KHGLGDTCAINDGCGQGSLLTEEEHPGGRCVQTSLPGGVPPAPVVKLTAESGAARTSKPFSRSIAHRNWPWIQMSYSTRAGVTDDVVEQCWIAALGPLTQRRRDAGQVHITLPGSARSTVEYQLARRLPQLRIARQMTAFGGSGLWLGITGAQDVDRKYRHQRDIGKAKPAGGQSRSRSAKFMFESGPGGGTDSGQTPMNSATSTGRYRRARFGVLPRVLGVRAQLSRNAICWCRRGLSGVIT
ncbi:hypothetical protein E3G50_005085, partial [Mycobacteroides abscessus]|nr:hypothetical protein [Mycobacteroides abscessus]